MKEIQCPNCHTIFSIDESDYQSIVKQVRDKEFAKEQERLEASFQKDLHHVQTQWQTKLDQARQEQQRLMEKKDWEKQDAINQALKKQEETIRQLQLRLADYDEKKKLELEKKELESQQTLDTLRQSQNQKIAHLEHLLQQYEAQKKLELTQKELEKDQAVQKVEQEKQSLVADYTSQLKAKDEMIAYYKDMKLKLSTKMLGETLEQHCENQFNQLRATGFQHSYFEKDNDASSGSKGDYIFKEVDENGVELISIMFEMKNEADQTATKKTNESFLKELDKDRREKHCEYAVLVSLLEPESELYNSGIVDMSHRYDKMYVIRPQFFIPIITILRNAALKNAQIRQELETIKEQNIDITHFEDRMMDFKEGFTKNVETASRKFQTAVDEIDKTITHLQKVRENLLASDRQLHLANKKVDNLSIRSLTYKNPTMQKMFKEQKKK